MADSTTFLKLIDKYRIEIPEIQREYAQGRATSQAEDIRKNFIKSLFETVVDDKKPLFLDYVYGRTEEKKRY